MFFPSVADLSRVPFHRLAVRNERSPAELQANALGDGGGGPGPEGQGLRPGGSRGGTRGLSRGGGSRCRVTDGP